MNARRVRAGDARDAIARPATTWEVRREIPAYETTRGSWGMYLFIATEAALFAFLFFSYFFLGSLQPLWPAEHHIPELQFPLAMTAALVSSSFVLHWGERGIRRGQGGRLLLGLGLTILLGLVFLSLQFFEYREHLESLTPRTNAYGSIFYTITSFHGTHLLIGLLMLSFVLVRAIAGHYDERRHASVHNVAAYWHFVDVVWLFVLSILYLSPRL